MLRKAVLAGAACTLLTITLGFVDGQQNNPSPPPGGAQKAPPSQALRAKTIIGATVQLQGNASAGTVEDIVFDSEGVIDYFIVSNNGKLVTVPWEAAKFNFEKRIAVINITQEQYQKIPTYTTQQYPNFSAPTYQTDVYRFYNLTPGQERRFERRIRK